MFLDKVKTINISGIFNKVPLYKSEEFIPFCNIFSLVEKGIYLYKIKSNIIFDILTYIGKSPEQFLEQLEISNSLNKLFSYSDCSYQSRLGVSINRSSIEYIGFGYCKNDINISPYHILDSNGIVLTLLIRREFFRLFMLTEMYEPNEDFSNMCVLFVRKDYEKESLINYSLRRAMIKYIIKPLKNKGIPIIYDNHVPTFEPIIKTPRFSSQIEEELNRFQINFKNYVNA